MNMKKGKIEIYVKNQWNNTFINVIIKCGMERNIVSFIDITKIELERKSSFIECHQID